MTPPTSHGTDPFDEETQRSRMQDELHGEEFERVATQDMQDEKSHTSRLIFCMSYDEDHFVRLLEEYAHRLVDYGQEWMYSRRSGQSTFQKFRFPGETSATGDVKQWVPYAERKREMFDDCGRVRNSKK